MRTFRSIVAGLFVMLIASTAWAAACDGFTDVDSANSTYCSAVTYLKDKGITLGCTGTTYCPNDYVTRLQMALFLQRMGRGAANNTLGHSNDSIGGGDFNTTGGDGINDGFNVIGGGYENTANGSTTVVGGGYFNTTGNTGATVSGGLFNVATGVGSTVTGGGSNTASGDYSTVVGGADSIALGTRSTVMGTNAQTTANATGSIVIGDSTAGPIGSDAPNEFIVGASGGIRMLSNKNGTTGCSIAAGGGTWACTSAKESKRDFEDIDRQEILDRVLALPVQRWRYVNEAPDVRHMGTYAQDFRAAFGLGSDDKTISMADADGVALAAIQGLNARLAVTVAQQSHHLAEMAEQLSAVARDLQALRASVH